MYATGAPLTAVICPQCKKEMSEELGHFICNQCGNVVSTFDVNVENSIIKILDGEKVAYRNEFRYRLEKDYYHTVTDYGLRRLEQGKAYNDGLKLIRTQLPGRKAVSEGTPNVFFKLKDADYSSLVSIMRKKLDLSTFVSELSSPAGFHAQELWRDVFRDLGYEIVKEDVSEFEGRKATIGGDIDFIARIDGISFGVEVKNGLEYPKDLANKVQIAIELGTIPVLVMRRIPWDVYQNLKKYGVLAKIYETSILPAVYQSVVEECKSILGMPLIALDKISSGPIKHLQEKVMVNALGNVDAYRAANETYLKAVRAYRKRIEALNRELRFV
jgi:predicted RecB family endonuclease